MNTNLDVMCSVWERPRDMYGSFKVGKEEIRQMSLRDFFLSGKWEDVVKKYRFKRSAVGSAMMTGIPCITASGLFKDRRSLHSDVVRTGYLVLDIEAKGDMSKLLDKIRKDRKEVEVLQHSLRGTNYMALVRLAYPDSAREQYKALYNEYRKLGIELDRYGGDVTHLTFATWDEHPFVREEQDVVPFEGLAQEYEK